MSIVNENYRAKPWGKYRVYIDGAVYDASNKMIAIIDPELARSARRLSGERVDRFIERILKQMA